MMWALFEIGFGEWLILTVLLVVWVIKDCREHKQVKPHDYAQDEEFQKYIEEESAKVHEYYNKAKADWEKQHGRSWDD